jgi:hypothetical protein
MAERKNGLAPVPAGLFRPTTTDVEPADDPADEPEGRGDELAPADAPAKPRARKKSTPSGKTRARNIRLSDDVHDRLWQLARSRRQTLSAVADDLLNKALPRWEIKRQA